MSKNKQPLTGNQPTQDKPKNPCPYHPDVELERKGRANWHCHKCGRSVMLELVYIAELERSHNEA